ncbi:MAG TPA: ABC transporter permease [Mycobacteriales bacterium]|nr:ABC transporter permease [Mycobacteriales bacterium]
MRVLSDFWRICRSDKGALVGGVICLVYVFFAIFGPILMTAGQVQDPSQSYLGPSWKHPLGTDFGGNGIAAEIIVGTRPIMEVGVLAAIATVFVGVVVGLGSGYIGGVADSAIMRLVDIVLAIPGLPLIIVITSVVHTSNPFVLAGILSVTAWAGLARAVRSQALSLRNSGFIEAARMQGLPLRHMVLRQLVPNVGPYVAIHFLLTITGAIYAEVGLFLLGVAPTNGTNWGTMINLAMGQGALYTSKSMLYVLAPMAAIVILQVSFVFFSRALDQLFNPRLRVR